MSTNDTTEPSYGWKILNSLTKGTTLYTITRHTSASGMTRWISVFYVDETGRICRVRLRESSFWMKKKRHGADYRVPGAGMDMGFHLVYTMGQLVHGDGYYFRQEWL